LLFKYIYHTTYEAFQTVTNTSLIITSIMSKYSSRKYERYRIHTAHKIALTLMNDVNKAGEAIM